MAGVAGLEPVTSGVTGRRSNQLSYTPANRGPLSTPDPTPRSSMLQQCLRTPTRIAGLHDYGAIWARRMGTRRFDEAWPHFGHAALCDFIEINGLSTHIEATQGRRRLRQPSENPR